MELNFFGGSQKFVAFNSGDYADSAFVSCFGALNAAKAADADRAGKSDFVGESE